MINFIVETLNANKKAIVAGVLAAVVAYLAKHGLALNPATQDALGTFLSALVNGLVVGLPVWFATNKPKAV